MRSVPSSTDRACTAWVATVPLPLALVPMAASTYKVRRPASMTGVPVIPSGLMLPQPAPVLAAEGPSVVLQTASPVASESATTWLLSVATKKVPWPPGPSSRYSGWA